MNNETMEDAFYRYSWYGLHSMMMISAIAVSVALLLTGCASCPSGIGGCACFDANGNQMRCQP